MTAVHVGDLLRCSKCGVVRSLGGADPYGRDAWDVIGVTRLDAFRMEHAHGPSPLVLTSYHVKTLLKRIGAGK